MPDKGENSALLMAYYGDDFTRSADATEALTVNGVKTALFLGHPTEKRLTSKLNGLHAVGISGSSRAMTPDEMDEELPAQFRLLDGLSPRLIHHKVCATLDSSPRIGDIGRAADIGIETIKPTGSAIVQGIPLLGRYIAFGNHFTVYGDQRFRLDRHPVMSKHPITPMNEGGIRVHLAQMSNKSVALIDLVHLDEPFQSNSRRHDRCLADGTDLVLFDTLNDKHLAQIGHLLHEKSENGKSIAIGPSGLDYAMSDHWQSVGLVDEPPEFPAIDPTQKSSPCQGALQRILLSKLSARWHTALAPSV